MTTSMEVEGNPEQADQAEESLEADETNEEVQADVERDDIISFLTYNKDISFKNQQRWEADLTTKQKFDIALELFQNNKLNFLIKFGKYLKHDQLAYFKRFTENIEPDSEEIKVVLGELHQNCSENAASKQTRNRRYEALKQMVEEESYFSEIEMMKRNPLLYQQLVGQYMTKEEIRERDSYKTIEEMTLVKILMEGIEREDAEKWRKHLEEIEGGQEEEEDQTSSSDEDRSRSPNPLPSTSRWGEFEEDKLHRPKPKAKPDLISAEERMLLKKEFVTSMYQSFLDGNDEDFNYDTVDNNASYDNIIEMDNDAEEKYFASEDVEDGANGEGNAESSEDELDMYMNALNQHPAVGQLSNDLKKM